MATLKVENGNRLKELSVPKGRRNSAGIKSFAEIAAGLPIPQNANDVNRQFVSSSNKLSLSYETNSSSSRKGEGKLASLVTLDAAPSPIDVNVKNVQKSNVIRLEKSGSIKLTVPINRDAMLKKADSEKGMSETNSKKTPFWRFLSLPKYKASSAKIIPGDQIPHSASVCVGPLIKEGKRSAKVGAEVLIDKTVDIDQGGSDSESSGGVDDSHASSAALKSSHPTTGRSIPADPLSKEEKSSLHPPAPSASAPRVLLDFVSVSSPTSSEQNGASSVKTASSLLKLSFDKPLLQFGFRPSSSSSSLGSVAKGATAAGEQQQQNETSEPEKKSRPDTMPSATSAQADTTEADNDLQAARQRYKLSKLANNNNNDQHSFKFARDSLFGVKRPPPSTTSTEEPVDSSKVGVRDLQGATIPLTDQQLGDARVSRDVLSPSSNKRLHTANGLKSCLKQSNSKSKRRSNLRVRFNLQDRPGGDEVKTLRRLRTKYKGPPRTVEEALKFGKQRSVMLYEVNEDSAGHDQKHGSGALFDRPISSSSKF